MSRNFGQWDAEPELEEADLGNDYQAETKDETERFYTALDSEQPLILE